MGVKLNIGLSLIVFSFFSYHGIILIVDGNKMYSSEWALSYSSLYSFTIILIASWESKSFIKVMSSI